jgi:DNA-directed RNA polymerase subunit beta
MPRKQFTKKNYHVPLPDLIEVQKKSYKWLFDEGIQELLREISPVDDFTGKNLSLEFTDYFLDSPKYDEATARAKNLTYKAPLKCKVCYTINTKNQKK